jgi:hypothetical protein
MSSPPVQRVLSVLFVLFVGWRREAVAKEIAVAEVAASFLAKTAAPAGQVPGRGTRLATSKDVGEALLGEAGPDDGGAHARCGAPARAWCR